ncbi:MAG: hypothetical protein ACI33S_04995 [Bacilli bacterium]
MEIKREIDFIFDDIIECMNCVDKSDVYNKNDKENLIKIKNKIEYWYKSYLKNSTLKEIMPNDIEYIDLELTDFFDKYIKIESVKENYSERILYNFSHLMKEWKNEMLGGMK